MRLRHRVPVRGLSGRELRHPRDGLVRRSRSAHRRRGSPARSTGAARAASAASRCGARPPAARAPTAAAGMRAATGSPRRPSRPTTTSSPAACPSPARRRRSGSALHVERRLPERFLRRHRPLHRRLRDRRGLHGRHALPSRGRAGRGELLRSLLQEQLSSRASPLMVRYRAVFRCFAGCPGEYPLTQRHLPLPHVRRPARGRPRHGGAPRSERHGVDEALRRPLDAHAVAVRLGRVGQARVGGPDGARRVHRLDRRGRDERLLGRAARPRDRRARPVDQALRELAHRAASRTSG